jgi:hypothetical protein
MPQVKVKTARKTFPCNGCSEKIKPGQRYYTWAFRYGGKRRKHVEHGQPKPSELTQSKLSCVYAAVEAAQVAITSADTPDDIASALNECASEVENVRSEYEDGLSNLPEGLQAAGGPGGQTQEKIDALQEFQDELESTASDIESESESDEEESPAENEAEKKQEWIQELRSKAEDALSSLSI